MTLYDFVRLDLDFRAEMVWERGELLGSALNNDGGSLFYALEGFFVEVVYNEDRNKVLDVAPFSEGPRYDRLVEILGNPLPWLRDRGTG